MSTAQAEAGTLPPVTVTELTTAPSVPPSPSAPSVASPSAGASVAVAVPSPSPVTVSPPAPAPSVPSVPPVTVTAKEAKRARRAAAADDRRRVTAHLAYTAAGRTKAASAVIFAASVAAFVFNAVVSYNGLYEFAAASGQPAWLAALVPFAVDTFIVIGGASAVVHRNDGWSVSRLKAWAVLLGFDAMSAYGQIAGAVQRHQPFAWILFAGIFPIGVAVAANTLETALGSLERSLARADAYREAADAAAAEDRQRREEERRVADAGRRRENRQRQLGAPSPVTVTAPASPSARPSPSPSARPSALASVATVSGVSDGGEATVRALTDAVVAGAASWADAGRAAGCSRAHASTVGRGIPGLAEKMAANKKGGAHAAS